MTINPHPFVMTAIVRQRLDEFQAQAARDDLANRAAGAGAARRQEWTDFRNAAAVVLALLVTASVAVARDGAPPALGRAAPVVTQTGATVDAAQTARETGD